MNNRQERSWSFELDLGANDVARLRNAIREELRYYNALVTGFSAPIRTMRETLLSFKDKKEQLFSVVAAMRIKVGDLKANALPKSLEPYADILFRNGVFALDTKSLLILDLATVFGDVPPAVRMAMATEVLRRAKVQSSDLAANRIDSTVEAAGSYKYAVTLLTPITDSEKRHCQLPQFSVTHTYDADKDEIAIQVPYLSKAVTMPKPPFKWSHIIVREDAGGKWLFELSSQKSNYIVGKTDFIDRKKKIAAVLWRPGIVR